MTEYDQKSPATDSKRVTREDLRDAVLAAVHDWTPYTDEVVDAIFDALPTPPASEDVDAALAVLRKWGLDKHEPFCVPARQCTCQAQIYRDVAAIRAEGLDERSSEMRWRALEAVRSLVGDHVIHKPRRDDCTVCRFFLADARLGGER